jgi:predicted nucleic acid-binding protein
MPFLFDTNHCIYLLNGLEKKAAFRSDQERNVIKNVRSLEDEIYISEVTLGELFYGAFGSQRKDHNLKRIEILKDIVLPVPVDETVWELFGETKANLKSQGKTLTDFDLLIGCTALAYGFVLVTNDAHFELLDAPKENWA